MSFFSIKAASKLLISTFKHICMCVVALGPRGLGDPPLSLWKGLRRGHPAPKIGNACWVLLCRQPRHTNELWSTVAAQTQALRYSGQLCRSHSPMAMELKRLQSEVWAELELL